jgi:hypothetical protein
MQEIANNLQANTYQYAKSRQAQSPAIPFNQIAPLEYDPPYYQYITAHSDNHKKNDISPQSELLLKRDGYSIYEVKTLKQKISASTLIKDSYAAKGYRTESATVFSHNRLQYTFEVRKNNFLAGTLTLNIDAGNGLLADQLYKAEIDSFRSKNHERKVCEVSKFVFRCNTGSKEIFALLFHTAYIYAHLIHDVDGAFIEINPRHAFFYRRMLGFRQIGDERRCPRVDAPAMLLHLNLLDYMRSQINDFTRPYDCRKKLYQHFLTPDEESSIFNRIKLRCAS